MKFVAKCSRLFRTPNNVSDKLFQPPHVEMVALSVSLTAIIWSQSRIPSWDLEFATLVAVAGAGVIQNILLNYFML